MKTNAFSACGDPTSLDENDRRRDGEGIVEPEETLLEEDSTEEVVEEGDCESEELLESESHNDDRGEGDREIDE